MKTKDLGSYFLYSLLLFAIIFAVGSIEIHLKQIVSETFTFYPWLIFRCFLYIPVGIALGLPVLMNERKKEGNWKFNYIKSIFVGVPAIYFTFYFVIYTFIGFMSYPFSLISSMPSNVVGGIVLGFVIITSFYKD